MVLTARDYTVGWITALPVELAVAKAMMDTVHPALFLEARDTNAYTLGCIGDHNVVLACLPTMGNNTAAHAAANMMRSFPSIRFALMVGIGGGVPGPISTDTTQDVRLGDIVISTPNRQHGGVIQYDFGTLHGADEGREFIRKGHLNKPPSILLNTIRELQADAEIGTLGFARHYTKMLEDHPGMARKFSRPIVDKLYKAEYHHRGNDHCGDCLNEGLVQRRPRSESIVHYGLIGSANRVLRSAAERDRLHKEEGVICFEMEAGGLMDEFSCIVIRGICDYCDSHKSKVWQPYASAMAAAFAKELLLHISPVAVRKSSGIQDFAGRLPIDTDKHDPFRAEVISLQPAKKFINPDQYRECLVSLNCVDPSIDKRRLEDTKGGLLRDVYKWILNTEEYNTWIATDEAMWIKGDPGKGKTMLICGIIDELKRPTAYFFCQATLDANNSAVQVLRGLILSILEAKSKISITIYDKIQNTNGLPAGSLFYALSDILETLLDEPETILIVDALDECLSGLDELLRFIVKTSTSRSCKWLVSSRNIPEIEEYLNVLMRLSLELNDASISKSVDFYIQYKVQELHSTKRYDRVDSTLQAYICQYLQQNSEGTFLWVSLVCKKLSKTKPHQVKVALKESPPGLYALYQQMLDTIALSDDQQVLEEMLAIVSRVFRPLTLDELSILMHLSEDADVDNIGLLQNLVEDCGCFLTIRNSTVNLVHQSAKDFLATDQASQVLKSDEFKTHEILFIRSVKSLQGLVRWSYASQNSAVEVGKIPIPEVDPVSRMEYAIIYWPNHLLSFCTASLGARLDGTHAKLVGEFLTRKFLYWLEALSWLGNCYSTIGIMRELGIHLQQSTSMLVGSSKDGIGCSTFRLFKDAIQFFDYFQHAIIKDPIQIYIAGLLFCPQTSFIREAFAHEFPVWATMRSGLKSSWPTLLSLDVEAVDKLQWSLNEEVLLTYNRRGFLQLWHASSGQLLFSIPGFIQDCIFSLDSVKILFLSCACETIEILSAADGRLLETIPLQASDQRHIIDPTILGWYDKYSTRCGCLGVLSRSGSHVARAWWLDQNESHIIEVNSMESGLNIGKLMHHRGLYDLKFVPMRNCLAAADGELDLYIWNFESGQTVWNMHLLGNIKPELIFSQSSSLFATCVGDITVWEWIEDVPQQLMILDTRKRGFEGLYVAFHPDNASVFTARHSTIQQWQIQKDGPIDMLNQLSSSMSYNANVIDVSDGGSKLAAANNSAVEIWNLHDSNSRGALQEVGRTKFRFQSLYLYNDLIYGAVFNNDNEYGVYFLQLGSLHKSTITLGAHFGTKRITDQTGSKTVIYTGEGSSFHVLDLASRETLGHVFDVRDLSRVITFGPEDTCLTGCTEGDAELWICTVDGQITDRWPAPEGNYLDRIYISHACWSPDRLSLVVTHDENVDVWNVASRTWRRIAGEEYEQPGDGDANVAFSADGSLLAVCSCGSGLRVFQTKGLDQIFSFYKIYETSVLKFEDQWLKMDTKWFVRDQDSNNIIPCPSKNLYLRHFSASWICFGERKLIWVPAEYRSLSWAANGDMFVLGLEDLQLVVLDIRLDEVERLCEIDS